MNIAVVGGHKCSKKNYEVAIKLGRLIAQQGWVLICGGGPGVMEAASRGAKEQGGLTVGILPGYKKEDANAYLDVKLPTGVGLARNIFVVRAADAVIAVNGEYGTLSEIAFALSEEKVVLGIETWAIKGVKLFKNPQGAVKYIKKLMKGK